MSCRDDLCWVGSSRRRRRHGVWRRDAGGVALSVTDLGTVGRAIAINERGQIVGKSTTASGKLHAFVWQSGKMTDLGTLGGKQSKAVAINDHGQIVGWAMTASGKKHAVLWTLKRG